MAFPSSRISPPSWVVPAKRSPSSDTTAAGISLAGERAGRRARDASAEELARERAPASVGGQAELPGREEEAESGSRPGEEHRAARVVGAVAAGGDERSEPPRSRRLGRRRMWKRLDTDVDRQAPRRPRTASVPKAVRLSLEAQGRPGRAAEHLEPDGSHLPDSRRAGSSMRRPSKRACVEQARHADQEDPHERQSTEQDALIIGASGSKEAVR